MFLVDMSQSITAKINMEQNKRTMVRREREKIGNMNFNMFLIQSKYVVDLTHISDK